MVDLIGICDERLRAIFSYPTFNSEHYSRVLLGMRRLGVEGIESGGPTEVNGIKVLGKGCVGIVAVARKGQNRVAVKILRADANRTGLSDEATLLAVANAEGVGPLLYDHAESVLMMEYIDGSLLGRWLQRTHAMEEIACVLRSLMEQSRRLDKAGLDHGELADAKKHIIVDGAGKPRIIDFETASLKRTCRNLTSMANYLFFKESVSMLTGRAVCIEKEGLRDALRRYKEDPSDERYEDIVVKAGLRY